MSRAWESEDGLQHRLDLLSCEAGEQDLQVEPFPVQLRQEMAQAGAYLVTAVGQQEEKPMSGAAPCQVVQEVQAGVVATVEVFQNAQHGVSSGQAGQELGQGLKAAALLLFRIERGEGG